MSTSLVIVLLLSSFQLARVSSSRLTINPDHVKISQVAQSVSFICSADVALTGCQFRWRDNNGKVGPLLDLSQGSLSKANYSNLNAQFTGYCYNGRGMGEGDCGVSMQVTGGKVWMVACRVRAKTGGWTYAWAGLTSTPRSNLPTTLTPGESVVLPDGEARFTIKVQESVAWCYFYVPGIVLVFDQGGQSGHSTGRYRYVGEGVKAGDCGLAMANVSEADNGPVVSWIGNAVWTKDDYRFMAIVVAHPPGPPTLSVVYTDFVLTATCTVHEGRPVADISWVLGDDVIRQDSVDDSPGHPMDEWRWPWMKGSVMQSLTVRLQAKDNGKILKCVVSHVALAQPLEVVEIITLIGLDSETAPLKAARTARHTVSNSLTAASTCTCPFTSPGASTDPSSTTASTLGLLCQEYGVTLSQLSNTSCTNDDDVHELRVREARAASRAAELVEEQAEVLLRIAKAEEENKAMLAQIALEAAMSSAKAEEENKAMLAKVALEAARSSAKSEEENKAMLAIVELEAAKSRAKAEGARALESEAKAKNAEEELEFERERRSQSEQQPLSV